MWLRLTLEGDIAYCSQPQARYRQHAATISRATSRSGERLACDLVTLADFLRSERRRIPDRDRARMLARAGRAVKAFELAGDLFTRGQRRESLAMLGIATRVAPLPRTGAQLRLALATVRGDADGSFRANRELLRALARRLAGTRFGDRLAASTREDDEWQAALERAAAVVRRLLPADATIGAVTKWDPTLLKLAGRSGINFPDRGELPDGYPADGAAAVAHLELLQVRGLTHLVFPSTSFWWLDHYRELAGHLESDHTRMWRNEDCVIYALREPRR
jgi:hypothetical protein